MNKTETLKRIFNQIKAKYGLSTTLVIKSESDMFAPIFQRADWFCLIGDGPSYICLNDEKFDSVNTQGLVNILCHEFGHIMDNFKTPEPSADGSLEDVISYEKAANDIGRELYAEYFPLETYWNNHEDIIRMQSSYSFYTEGKPQVKELPDLFKEDHEPA